MESQLQNSSQEEIMMNNGSGKMSASSYLCRQSSTRWTPTTEQIKLLKELYYINGVRSPTADQIQSICARLRRYGKIEGKNVFYWFQNHKARERQKKRLTPTVTTTTPEFHDNIIRNNGVVNWKQEEVTLNNGYSCNTNNPGISCASSSAGMVPGGGQSIGSFGYGPVTMENKFRDCSISGGGSLINGNGDVNQWTKAGGANYNTYVPPTCYSNFLNKISGIDEDKDHYSTVGQEIETLPLFPMHNEELNGHQNHGSHLSSNGFYTIKSPSDGYYTGGYHWSNGSGGNGASLELSLNSYGYSCFSNY